MRRGEGSGEEGLLAPLPKPHLHPPPDRKSLFQETENQYGVRGKPAEGGLFEAAGGIGGRK